MERDLNIQAIILSGSSLVKNMVYQPTVKSIARHKVPGWFVDAKLGIFIHWGLYSVPAFAPVDYGDIVEIITKHGFPFHFKHNPYAEWYLNSLRTGSKVYLEYHEKNFGKNFKYEQFADNFKEEVKKWDPARWASLFKKAGAGYCVLTTKHHDGFLLWPSEVRNPNAENYFSERDLVGELAAAARKEGLRFGTYYSGCLDWSFEPTPIVDVTTMAANPIADEGYAMYAHDHYMELIERYKPDVLWNDIGYPKKGKRLELIAHYLNTVTDGAVNNRWTIFPTWYKILPKTFLLKKFLNWAGKQVVKRSGLGNTGKAPRVGDYLTPEYSPRYRLSKVYFESCRGIGRSFGYNQMEKEEHYLSEKELVWSFIDIVSKNGNLLLNIGPMADGRIPEIQEQRLLQLGRWLERNGEGIHGSRPWTRAEGTTGDGIPTRFTTRDGNLYVFLQEIPPKREVTLDVNLHGDGYKEISLLGMGQVDWRADGSKTIVSLPDIPDDWVCPGLACTKG